VEYYVQLWLRSKEAVMANKYKGVIVGSPGIYTKVGDQMTWPSFNLGDLEWRLRYAPESIKRGEELFLASVLSAYRELILKTQSERNEICRALREAKIVTLDSARQAIEHMEQYNEPGRKADARRMLVSAAHPIASSRDELEHQIRRQFIGRNFGHLPILEALEAVQAQRDEQNAGIEAAAQWHNIKAKANDEVGRAVQAAFHASAAVGIRAISSRLLPPDWVAVPRERLQALINEYESHDENAYCQHGVDKELVLEFRKRIAAAPQQAQDDFLRRYESLKFRKRELETEVSDLRNTLTALRAQQAQAVISKEMLDKREAFEQEMTTQWHMSQRIS
jgi:hypothetical protein